MSNGFWADLPKPFFVSAPLANVTDAAFRRMIAKYGKPDVTYTEFVSADGLCSAGQAILLRDLVYSEAERPILAQLFSSNPTKLEQAAALVKSLGFDGLDINMGCPDRNVEKQGAGAALIKNPSLAKELILAAKQGASGLPVSVKTRTGFNQDQLETWLPALLSARPAAIAVHARTRKEMSKVPARWETVATAVKLAAGTGTLIIGNGDVLDLADARRRVQETGCDGVMLGRALFGNPWLFSGQALDDHTPAERLAVMLEHAKLFEELLGDIKPWQIMKKHFKAYVSDWPDSKELRVKLMDTNNSKEVEELIANAL
jgi:nifR3 family TIM-barrel protein